MGLSVCRSDFRAMCSEFKAEVGEHYQAQAAAKAGSLKAFQDQLMIRPRETGYGTKKTARKYDPNTTKGLVPFTQLRSLQVKIRDYIQKCRDEGRAAWIVVHKSRQHGGASTESEAILFQLVHENPMRRALVMAHQAKSTQTIFQQVKYFELNLPEHMRRPLVGKKVHKNFLEYDHPHGSSFDVMTAGSDTSSLGGKYDYVHLSELAFMEKPDAVLQSLLPAIPRPEESSDVVVIVESTARGEGVFKELVDDALSGETFWYFIFGSWLEENECRLPLEPGEVPFIDKRLLEAKRRWFPHADDEQMKWAQYILKNICRNKIEVFHQEYPAVWELAFLYTGNPVFDNERVQDMLDRRGEPLVSGGFRWVSETLPYVEPYEIVDGGPLEIYQHPQPGVKYVVGIDPNVGHGTLADFLEMVVMRTDTEEEVACFRTNTMQGGAAAIVSFMLGRYYNWALIGCEAQQGTALLENLRDGIGEPQMIRYPNLYYSKITNRKLDKPTDRIGFVQTQGSKKKWLEDTMSEGVDEGRLWFRGKEGLLQMKGFAWDESSRKYVANHKDPDTGRRHDDGVMSRMIAVAMLDAAKTHDWAMQTDADDLSDLDYGQYLGGMTA